jgi:hypothetical protein
MEPTIHNIKIAKAKNGYIVYTNESVISLQGTHKENYPIYVFETLENLNAFLFNNFNLNN